MINSFIYEIINIFSGLIAMFTAWHTIFDKKNTRRIGTFFFWFLFSIILIFGTYIPAFYIGLFVIFMAILSGLEFVIPTLLQDSSEEFKIKESKRIGYSIWIPTFSLGVFSIVFSLIPGIEGVSGLAIGCFFAYILSFFISKSSPLQGVFYESPRMLHKIGKVCILPQILGILGFVFSESGVGYTIFNIFVSIIPMGNKFIGVLLYVLSMFIFTVLMGNAFAAFSIITVGIGVPYLLNLGANPDIVGSLGLTAGYCGTLVTPMAANFNIVPISILDIKDKYGIVKEQIPVSISLLLIHIILIYLFAF